MKTSTTAIFGPLLLATYAAILLYATGAYLTIGHWPSYGNPDPNSLPTFWFCGPIIFVLILASALSVVVYPFFSVAYLCKGSLKAWRTWAIAAILLYTAVAFLILGQKVSVHPGSQPNFRPFLYLVILPSLFAVVTCSILANAGQHKEILRKWHFWAYIAGFGLWALDSYFFHLMNPQQEGLLSWIFD